MGYIGVGGTVVVVVSRPPPQYISFGTIALFRHVCATGLIPFQVFGCTFSVPFSGNGANVQVGYGVSPIAFVGGGVIGTQLFPPRFVLLTPFCEFSTVLPFCLLSLGFCL